MNLLLKSAFVSKSSFSPSSPAGCFFSSIQSVHNLAVLIAVMSNMSSPTPPPKPPRRGQVSSPVPEARSASPPSPKLPLPAQPAQTTTCPPRAANADKPIPGLVKNSPFLKNNSPKASEKASLQSTRSASPPPPTFPQQRRSVSP
ncbi:hypothetical protein EON65_08820, partial [archaeon]